MKDVISPKKIRQVFTLFLIVFFALLIFIELTPYLSGVLGALTLYVLLRKPMHFLVERKWKSSLAAGFLIVSSIVCILIPISGIVLMLTNKISKAVKNYEEIAELIKNYLNDFESNYGFNISSSINTSKVSNFISSSLENFAGTTFNIFIAVGLMYFLLYYMLINRKSLKTSIFEYIPVSKKNLKIIGTDVVAMVRSNAIGIPLVALAQGVIALIGFLIFGIEEPFFWFTMVTIGSMIPFVGTALGIIPVFILTLSSGNSFAAWGILIYGAIVVSATDNLIRLYVLQKLDNVHPLITLIGVIVGVPLFGFIGLIFGPILISLFLILVKIYKKEFGLSVKDEKVL